MSAELDQLPRSVGVSSLAAGTDQIFARLVLEHAWQLHVVVPCHNYESTFRSADDKQSFKELYRKATRRDTLAFSAPDEEAFLQAGKYIVDMSNLMIFVWNGLPARGRGGTADIFDYAISNAVPFVHIDPVRRDVKRNVPV